VRDQQSASRDVDLSARIRDRAGNAKVVQRDRDGMPRPTDQLRQHVVRHTQRLLAGLVGREQEPSSEPLVKRVKTMACRGCGDFDEDATNGSQRQAAERLRAFECVAEALNREAISVRVHHGDEAVRVQGLIEQRSDSEQTFPADGCNSHLTAARHLADERNDTSIREVRRRDVISRARQRRAGQKPHAFSIGEQQFAIA
jgi:hypothetical protein